MFFSAQVEDGTDCVAWRGACALHRWESVDRGSSFRLSLPFCLLARNLLTKVKMCFISTLFCISFNCLACVIRT